jgi:hypothetical protein
VITIFGKSGCKKCESAMKKMALLEIKFDYVDLTDFDSWRKYDNGLSAREGMAEYTIRDWEELPLFLMETKWMTYPEAMLFLKGKNNGQ